MIMREENSINIHVKRGVKVHVQEVDQLAGDRELIAEVPAGLKIVVRRGSNADVGSGLNKITMCG